MGGGIPVTARVLVAVSSLAVVYHVLFVSRLLTSWFDLVIMPFQHRAISLGFMLVLAFLSFPVARGKRPLLRVLVDLPLIMISVGTALYPILFFQDVALRQMMGTTTPIQQALGALILFLVLEASRRVIGLGLPLVALVFLAHPFVAQWLPGILGGNAQSLSRIFNVILFSSDGIFGTVLHIGSTIIVMFIVLGVFLQYTGAAEFFLAIANVAVGRFRGGPAKMAVVASALMGSVSGSSAANAATTGSLTIPMMKRSGYSAPFASAVEAVASNGGQILPPIMGVVAFLVAEFLGVPYAQVVKAGLLPALLYYLVLFVQVDLRAARLGLKAVSGSGPGEGAPRLLDTLKDGWIFLIPLGILLYLLIGLRYSPENSAWLALLSLIAISFFRKESRLTLPRLRDAMLELPRALLPAGIATAAAGIIMASLGLTGFGMRLASGLIDLAGGNLYALLILGAVISFVLGMGMSSVPVYVILATTVAPNLIKLGIDPMAAHLFVFWWGITSFITPPVAITVYVTSSIAQCDSNRAGIEAAKLGVVNYIMPFMFVLHPVLLLSNAPVGEVVLTILTCTFGALVLAAAVEGYLNGPLSGWERAALGLASLTMISPGIWTDAAGVLLFAAVYGLRVLGQRRVAAGAAPTARQTQQPPTRVEGEAENL